MQNRMGKHEHEAHDKLGQHERNHMMDGDIRRAFSHTARRHHEVGLLALQNFGTNNAGEVRPVRNRHAHGNAPKALAERIGDKHEQNNMRHAHHEVNEPADHGVDPRTAKRRSRAKNHRDNRRHACGDQPQHDARRKARKCARKHVSAHPIGTERMGKAGRERLQRKIGRGRRIGKRHTRDNHEHEQNRGNHELGKRRDAIDAPSTRRMKQRAQLQRFANHARRLRHRAAHVRQGASARHLAHGRANHRRHRRPRFFGLGRIASLARNARPACAFAHLPTTNTRVNHPVKNIRNQVSAEHKHGRNHGDARQKGRISAEASRNRRLAQTGI